MAEPGSSHTQNEAPPPVYFNALQRDNIPVPTYSAVAHSSEHVVPGAQSSCSHCYVYKTDHLEMFLGRSLWGSKQPVYGLRARPSGKINFKKTCSYVVALTARVRVVAFAPVRRVVYLTSLVP